jgi:PTS system nitrogen regulatory IIA component
MVKLADYLYEKDILLGVEVLNKNELFGIIGRHIEELYHLPQGLVATSLSRREQAGSTAIGDGVAVPHARLDELDDIHVVFLRLKMGINFSAPDKKPVADFVVLLVPNPSTSLHLELLAEVARVFSNLNFRELLGKCRTASQVKELFDAV